MIRCGMLPKKLELLDRAFINYFASHIVPVENPKQVHQAATDAEALELLTEVCFIFKINTN